MPRTKKTSKSLVIVESPTKAKTIEKFLGSDYEVVSSFGHLRDLPQKKMGIDIKNNFEPDYVIMPKSKQLATKLKELAKKSGHIYLATDEDREGEAIAWHLAFILGLDDKKEYGRIVFHEITEEAIKEALKNPRKINNHLVDAQQGRRILDRLVGYELSPFLWKKVAKGLSAGRVQSVALRLIVEREREIKAFKPQEYWSIDAELQKKNQPENTFKSSLKSIGDKKIDKLSLSNQKEVEDIINDLTNAQYFVSEIEKKQIKRNPPPPFITSTLQQEANRKLGFSAQQTMYLAQNLYEGVALGTHGHVGLITYMRTDSQNLAEKFVTEARQFIKHQFGEKYLPPTSLTYKTKSKNAQEAHEAIRPTNIHLKPEDLTEALDKNQLRLYTLIWKRALACQMNPALLDSTAIEITAKEKKYLFRSVGNILNFDGFLKIYPDTTKESILPDVKKGEELKLINLHHEQHFTEPPARYSDASLVKKLEELEIGRPSTYAPTISTIIDRGYVKRQERRLVPQDISFVVIDLLINHFPEIVDYKFTARLEDDLDQIAEGKIAWQPLIKKFYMPFKKNLDQKYQEVSKDELINEESDEICEKCGAKMIIKTGRFGKFLACSAFPKCRNTKNLNDNSNSVGNQDGTTNIADSSTEPTAIKPETCPKCGSDLVSKQSRFGQFMACSGYPNCKYIKKNSNSTGITCPQCQKGTLVARRTRSKRIFYGCSNYPNCDFATWGKPTGEKCAKCGSLMVEAGDGQSKCSNKECK